MSTTTFAGLAGIPAPVAAALAQRGIRTPFPIQAEVVPLALNGSDILAQAPTGSGKTLAFGLPMIARCASRPQHRRDGQAGRAPRAAVRGLVLVPTRELAVQVCDELRVPAAASRVRVAAVFGGANINTQATAARRSDIVVATPGRLIDLLDRRAVDLRSVEALVLDEADRMLDMGFAPQVDRIVRQTPSSRQTMLFSATLDGAVERIVQRYIRSPRIVRVDPPADDGARVDHVFEPTTHHGRVETLVDVLDTKRELAVVFVRTKRGADRLSRKLCARGVAATAMHGGMTQSQRLRELRRFRAGTCSTLVATDVFARGIDLDNITHVVNYDPPEDADTYLHRIGRTGRAGRTGTGISLVADDQWKHMLGIADTIGLREDAEHQSIGGPAGS